MVGIILILLDPRFGLVNQLLGLVGIGPVDFMGERRVLPAHLRLVGRLAVRSASAASSTSRP